MTNQPEASRLAREGFDLWLANQLEAASACYVAALELADPDHYALADYHGEFAGVLTALGRMDDARQQFELAVAVETRKNASLDNPGLSVARYFLGEHLLSMHLPEQAIAAVKAGYNHSNQFTALFQAVEAEGLWALGRAQEATAAANRALELAYSDERRQRLRERLGHILAS